MHGFWSTTYLTLLMLFSDCACVVTDFKWMRAVTKMNGFISRDASHLAEFPVSSHVLCAAKCVSNVDCQSFFYDKNGGICQLHNAMFTTTTTLEASPTSTYYRQGSIVCGQNWVRFGDSCYFFGDIDMPYLTARALCVNMSGHLVQVDTRAEFNFLKTNMASHAPSALGYWNDLFEVTTNGFERWRTSGDPLKPGVVDWVLNNPDNYLGMESCTFFNKNEGYAIADLECINDVRTDGSSYGYPLLRPLCEKDF